MLSRFVVTIFALLIMAVNAQIIDLKEISNVRLSDVSGVIETIGQCNSYDFDSHSNFYIVDRTKKVIHKYNPLGAYLGEININFTDFRESYGIGTINIINDTILISDSYNISVLKFSSVGEFLCKMTIEGYNVAPFWPVSFGKSNYLNSGTLKKFFDYKTEGAKYIKEVSLLNKNFDLIKTLSRDSIWMDKSKEYDPGNYGLLCFNSDERAYIYKTSKEKYEISVFNTDGDSIFTIKKEYQKVPYSEEHKKMIADMAGGSNMKHRVEYKNSIHNILNDKYGKTWVRSSVNYFEDGKYYDVFENEKLIGRQKLGINNDEIPCFVKDKLVCYNFVNKTLTIYDY